MRAVVDESRFMWALAVSILLHALLLTLLPILRRAQLAVPPPQTLLDVDVLSLPQLKPAPPPAVAPPPQAQPAPAPVQQPPPQVPVPKNQIVSPPDAGEEKPPENTRLLSDRDNTVKQESVHRSDEIHEPTGPKQQADAAEEAKAEAPAEPKPQRKPVERPAPARVAAEARPRPAALPKLDQLLPGPGDLALASRDIAQEPTPAPARGAPVTRDLLASRGRNFSSFSGTSDYLPSVREGDITLLNTKAEMFAPFVRRVAMRVFQHLEIRLKQAIRGGSGGGREFAVVEAIMSKKGRLVNARVIQRESNSTLAADRQLLAVATPDVFFDENPPPGAEASDGNIHFFLLVDLMVQTYQNPRTGAPSAGYNGIAGVGLDSEPKRD